MKTLRVICIYFLFSTLFASAASELRIEHSNEVLDFTSLRACSLEEGFENSSKPGEASREYFRKIYIKLNPKDAEILREFSAGKIGEKINVDLFGVRVATPYLFRVLDSGMLELRISSTDVFQKIRDKLKAFDASTETDK